MEKTYTQEQLVRFIYGESSPEEMTGIATAMRSDFDLWERFQLMKDSTDALTCQMASPKQSTIENLLRYSRSTALEEVR
jgi:hypothetical protein